jgi:hypothetical protein
MIWGESSHAAIPGGAWLVKVIYESDSKLANYEN